MKITNIRHLKISATPYPRVNEHIVSIDDKDVGEVIKRIKVPTGKCALYVLIFMEVQTSGSLRIGEVIEFGNIDFEVTGIKDGWYQISTPERVVKNIEIWSENMEIHKKTVNCK